MTTAACKKSGRKHTPITSKAQRGFFGAEYARKKSGKKGKTSMSKAELKRHLEESKGKKLPYKAGQVGAHVAAALGEGRKRKR